MRLSDLNPRWLMHGGEGVRDLLGYDVPERDKIGITFDCPCGCETRAVVCFTNPPDGGPALAGTTSWLLSGDNFENMTLHPSIHRERGCKSQWHGWITGGEVTTC